MPPLNARQIKFFKYISTPDEKKTFQGGIEGRQQQVFFALHSLFCSARSEN